MADKDNKDKEKEAEAADKKAEKDDAQEEAKAENKEVASACSISIDDIFRQLHIKAASQVKDCKIENSAIEGEGKNAKFHGAGSHIIAALPLKGDSIDVDTAVKGLVQYVTWFNGPDVAKTITPLTVWPLEDNNTTDSTKAESQDIVIPSFKLFLNEDADADADKDKDISKDSKADDEKAKIVDKKQSKSAKGYYVTYKIAIKGQKESPLSDALKSFGAGLIKGLGIQGFSWKTGALGKEHTIGDLLDSLDKVFGKIDPEELRTRFTKNIKAKYPLTKNTDITYFDKNTIILHLKEKLSTKETLKIKTADYSLCYRVEANDKSKKLINTTVVADCVTRSIKGLFKKFKNSLKSDDVILINDYDENDKDLKKNAKKLEVSKNEKALTTDSIKVRSYSNMISEADDKEKDTATDKEQEKNFNSMNAKLKELSKKALADSYLEDGNTGIYTKDELTSKLKIDQTEVPDAFSAIDGEKVKYAFVIETKVQSDNSSEESKEKPTESINASLNSMMKMLFEENDKANNDKKLSEIESKVTNVFKTLFDNFKKLLGKDLKLSDPVVYDVNKKLEKTEITKKESLMSRFKFVNTLFENEEFNNEIRLLIESGRHTSAHINQLIDKVGSKNITANKDKIISTVKEYYKGKGTADEIKDKMLGTPEKMIDNPNGKPWDDSKVKKWNREHQADITNGKLKKRKKGYVPKIKQDAKPGIFDDFFNLKTEDEMKKWVDEQFGSIKKTDDSEMFVQAFWKALSIVPEKEEEKKETVKVNFYDVDPKTGEKVGDPLNDKPFEIEKDTLLKDNEEITDAVNKFNEQLKEEKHGEGDKEGYVKRGWLPDINDAKATDDPTEILAKYVEEEKKDKTYTVVLLYAPDQEKPNDTDVIKIDDKEDQTVKAGEAAKLPEKMPEIEGYEFKDWGDDTEKLKKVEEDITAVAKYEKKEEEKKKIKIIAKAPKDPSKPEDTEIIEEIEYDPDKSIEELLPKHPEKDGWEPNGWEPDPKSIKDPKEDIEITAKYKKKDDGDGQKEIPEEVHTYWICPDVNGFLTSKEISVKQNHTDVDFYIVPMKNLKMDNTDDDDSKEVEGKGK